VSTPLTDGRVTLREWTVDDAAWYAREEQDAEILRFTTASGTLTAADVARAIEAIDPARLVALLVTDADTGAPLGNLAVELHDGIGEVSYWVAASARGRGVATAAVVLVADRLFAEGRVHELRLHAHAANAASRRTAEKAGFVRDPERDGEREVKGELWPTVAYRRTSPGGVG
jgi:RimJ/RimL family protein N-acetyltransferase